MYIACTNNHQIPYLQVHEAYTVVENGKRKQKVRVLKNLGPLSRFDDGAADFLKRLRQSFKEGKQEKYLIPQLAELRSGSQEKRLLTIKFDKNSASDCLCECKNIGYFLLDAFYDSLGINDVISLTKSRSKISYDLNGLVKLLIFGRVLDPSSKQTTWYDKKQYLFELTQSNNLIEIYRTLDVLDQKSDLLQRRMNLKIKNTLGRDKSICFYDVTNYYFEIDESDQDLKDSADNILSEGWRKSGPSKAKNRKPIVQMGLFMDDNGIPIAYKLFPGNHIDQTTLRPAMKKTISQMSFGKVVVISDGGLNSDKNLAHIVSGGNGYIVSRSFKKSNQRVKAWILDQAGYTSNAKKTFKLKSQIRERIIEDENGVKTQIKEKIISYWSYAQYQRALKENLAFTKYLDKVIKFPDKLKDKQGKLEKYLIKTQVDKKTGKTAKTKTVLSLNMNKIKTEMRLMGYYTIMTSEIEMPDREVIDKYHGLSRIENCFRTIKTDLDGRPIFVSKPEHINAHFLICFIGLTMIRLIQYQILTYLGKQTNSTKNWELGLSATKITTALQNFQAESLPEGYFRLTKLSAEMKLILAAFNINADLKLPNLTELYQLKYAFDKTVNTLV